ncbi:MAG: FAD-binding oxidoreductase [Gammaproteobacteria bacterium]|nr:FAD-binding oxidoreductase [Gammaproteobacteria bacterium]
MSHQKFTLILQSREYVTPRVMKFTFVRDDGLSFDYLAGQFLTLHIPWEDRVLRRSYSIATIPDGRGPREIEIAVTEVPNGRATGILLDLQPGERLHATGPFGRFVLRDDPPSRYVLLATGTGVSPYRAMLPALGDRIAQQGFQASLLLGVRGPDELLFAGDFELLARELENFRFEPSFSRHRPNGNDIGRYGYVQQQLAEINLDPERDIVYLCGNPIMIDESVALLKERGFTNPRIRREKYVSSN